jgi:hypothetical protein
LVEEVRTAENAGVHVTVVSVASDGARDSVACGWRLTGNSAYAAANPFGQRDESTVVGTPATAFSSDPGDQSEVSDPVTVHCPRSIGHMAQSPSRTTGRDR